MPPLTKEVKSHRRILNDNKVSIQFPHLAKIDRSKWSLKDLFKALDWDKHSYVFAFNERSKMLVAQQHMHQLGIQFSNFFDAPVFEADHVNQFLQQEHFNDAETLFIAKYFSQYKLGHSLIDLNSSSDYKIFSALTSTKELPKNYPSSVLTNSSSHIIANLARIIVFSFLTTIGDIRVSVHENTSRSIPCELSKTLTICSTSHHLKKTDPVPICKHSVQVGKYFGVYLVQKPISSLYDIQRIPKT
ncbi:MAG: hypothetical protein H6765_02100 [Candidatus Peribacteria bacterium]|nr:MAG: hypothetical protein H6765_02100 [Candidatus Peribacteria bacterium]